MKVQVLETGVRNVLVFVEKMVHKDTRDQFSEGFSRTHVRSNPKRCKYFCLLRFLRCQRSHKSTTTRSCMRSSAANSGTHFSAIMSEGTHSRILRLDLAVSSIEVLYKVKAL